MSKEYSPNLAQPGVRVLLTGFGPFPSVVDNASAWLVAELALQAQARFPQCKIGFEILPTEWAAAPERLRKLLEHHDPDIVLSFGVAQDAVGFRLEARAANACRPAPDAAGLLPIKPLIRADGPAHIAGSAPIEAIAARLTACGHPVLISEDAGGYLCNAAYYAALDHAACCGSNARIVFVHLPSDLRIGALTIERAVDGALEILAVCLEQRMSGI